MSSVVYCKPIAKGIHAFYLNVGETTYYLFSQNYRRGVNKYFSNGVRLDKAVCFSSAKGDTALMRTMEKSQCTSGISSARTTLQCCAKQLKKPREKHVLRNHF